MYRELLQGELVLVLRHQELDRLPNRAHGVPRAVGQRRGHSPRMSSPVWRYMPLVSEQHCVRREGTQGDTLDLYIIGLKALRGSSNVGFRL